jgi:hypothetical protein
VHVARDAEELGLVGEGVRDLRVLEERLRGCTTLRQMPPQYFSSMIAVERPSWALRTAAT